MATPHQINILMVGATKVGKTSLLAAMTEQMEAEAREVGCNFCSVGSTGTALTQKRKQLKALVDHGGMTDRPEESIDGTSNRSDYRFAVDVDPLARNGPEFELRLTDLPGGWFTSHSDEAHKVFHESHMSFIVVDANALLEQPLKNKCGRYNDVINDPDQITQFYKDAFMGKKEPGDAPVHRAVFVLVRAESYMGGRNTSIGVKKEKMRQALTASYHELIDTLKMYGVRPQAVAIKTIGGIEFNNFEEVVREGETQTDSKPRPVFRILKDVGYKPEFCDVPLKLALSHGADVRNGQTDIFDDIMGMFNLGIKARLREFREKVVYNLNKEWVFDL
jgi:hypothetical protein